MFALCNFNVDSSVTKWTFRSYMSLDCGTLEGAPLPLATPMIIYFCILESQMVEDANPISDCY